MISAEDLPGRKKRVKLHPISIQLWFVLYYYTHSLVILSLFVDVKSIQFNQSIQFKKNEKIARWCCSTKMSKRNLKTMISPLSTPPQGCQGCQKIQKTILVSWSAKIQPKLKKPWKTVKIEQKLTKKGFSNCIKFGLNLSAPTHPCGL